MMKIIEKETKIICSNPTNPHHAYFAWPSVARLQDGRLAMVASGFRNQHICPFGKVVMCVSDDEGKTWTRPMIVMDTPLDDRDAGILPFGENSVLITSFNNRIEWQRGVNHKDLETAKRWGNQRSQSPYVEGYLDIVDAEKAEEQFLGSTFIMSHDGGKTFGEVKRVPVSAPHGPTLMRDGSVLYVGRACTPLAEKEGDGIEAYKIYPDGSFEKLGEIENVSEGLYSCEPHAIVLESGKIIVHIRVQNMGYFTIFQSESYDDGKTFTKPHQLLGKRGGAPAHLLQLKDGTLVSSYGYRTAPFGIKFMFSQDEGETWDVGHDIHVLEDEENSDLGYPASVELQNGDILTVYYTRENMSSPSVIMQTIWKFER